MTNKLNLEQAILEILKKNQNIKAREIVENLKSDYQIEIDKTSLNKILYGSLSSKLDVNDYKWSLKTNREVANQVKVPEVKNTLLSKLSAYYLDCLSKDTDTGVSVYASNKYGSPDFGQIFSIPNFIETNTTKDFDLIDVKNTFQKVRKDRNRLVLQIGYPLYLRNVSTPKYNFNLVEPLFLLPIDMDLSISTSELRIKEEIPNLNITAVKNLSGLEKNELQQEILILNEELGLDNSWENFPDLDELILNLKRLRPKWNWLENIDISNLKKNSIKDEGKSGIYNAAAVFFTERSKYTVGLEKELQDFQKFDQDQLSSSSLGDWLSGQFSKFDPIDFTLLEPLPLNDEQRNAVNLSLQSPLTVITGPPGTGKSQVVTSLIINAVYNGQTVLFSSKNHKAVDVVFTRINALAQRHIMLRLGNAEMQSELAKYLSTLLSEQISSYDLENLDIFQRKRTELVAKSKDLQKKDQVVLNVINENNELDQKINQIKKKIGPELLNRSDILSNVEIENVLERIGLLRHDITKLERVSKIFVLRIVNFFQRKLILKKISNHWDRIVFVFNSLSIEIPKVEINEKNIDLYISCIKRLVEVLETRKNIAKYQDNINELNNNYKSFEISKSQNELEDLIAENSLELWSSWLKALPHRLNQENRKTLGEFNTLLNLMVNSSIEKNTPDRSILAKYYKILPRIANILPCWAVTSLSVKGKVPFQPGFFDLVIIDEASQCDISSALPLLYRAKRAVIIGDNKQLSHISTISTNQDIQLLEKYNLGEKNLIWSYVGNSLFGLAQSICEQKHIITLKDHHRSHSDIIDFSNNEFYGGQLRVATDYKKLKSINKEPSLRWENVEGRVMTPQSGGAYNEIEANVVVSELKRIVENNYEGTIGVVSPFRAQADLINKLINKDIVLSEKLTKHNFMADTVHRFQGDEKDLIIFSTVISKELQNGAKSFLTKTGNLFNVAITRARSILLVVGDFHECSKSGINYMENFTKYVTKLKTKNSIINLSIHNLGPKYPIIPWEVKVSDWEKEFYEVLFRVNIKTIPQFKVDQYSLDLALIVGEKKLDIEIDGKHFHQNWDGDLMVRDKIRNKRLIELGWDVQRFWVHELENDLDGCVSKINNWLSNNQ